MEEDPLYKQMIRKSFIMKKQPVQIPKVKKKPKTQHHGLTTFFMSTAIHILIYPFDTIKNRVIARNRIHDVAWFTKNGTANLTTYLGIFRGYISVMIGSLCHLSLGKQNFIAGAFLEGILKTWVDMTKISKQMGNLKIDLEITKKTLPLACIYAILRDLTFRSSYLFLFEYLSPRPSQFKFYDNRKRINNIFISVIIGTVISQPFDICFVKIASQRIMKYLNIWSTVKTIWKEESASKLMVAGLWPRLVYNLLSTLILVNNYDQLVQVMLQII